MFKDMIDKQIIELKKLWANKRQLTFQLLNLAMIVFSALMIWKGLMFMTKVRTMLASWSILFLCIDAFFTRFSSWSEGFVFLLVAGKMVGEG